MREPFFKNKKNIGYTLCNKRSDQNYQSDTQSHRKQHSFGWMFFGLGKQC